MDEEYNMPKENRERVWITEKGEQKGHKGTSASRGFPWGRGERGDKRARVLLTITRGTLCPSLFLKTPGNIVNRAEDGGESRATRSRKTIIRSIMY